MPLGESPGFSQAINLVDFIEELGSIGWMARFAGLDRQKAHFDYDDDAGYAAALVALGSIAERTNRTQARPLGRMVLRYRTLRRRIATEPLRHPTDEDAVWAYVCGQIRASSACSAMGWSPSDLNHLCARYGFAEFNDIRP